MIDFEELRAAKERLTDSLAVRHAGSRRARSGSKGIRRVGQLFEAAQVEGGRRPEPVAVGITRTADGRLAHLVLGRLEDADRSAIRDRLGGSAPIVFKDASPPRPLGAAAGGGMAGRLHGTLGSVVHRNGEEGVLTAVHVAVDMANTKNTELMCDGHPIAQTQRHTPQRPGWLYADAVFAALWNGARVDDRQGSRERIVRGIHGLHPSGLIGRSVVKVGARTGRTEGRIEAVEVDLLGVPGFSDDPGFTVNLGRHLLVSGEFADEGDSGALAFLPDSELAVGVVSTAVGGFVALSAWWQIEAILGVQLRSTTNA